MSVVVIFIYFFSVFDRHSLYTTLRSTDVVYSIPNSNAWRDLHAKSLHNSHQQQDLHRSFSIFIFVSFSHVSFGSLLIVVHSTRNLRFWFGQYHQFDLVLPNISTTRQKPHTARTDAPGLSSCWCTCLLLFAVRGGGGGGGLLYMSTTTQCAIQLIMFSYSCCFLLYSTRHNAIFNPFRDFPPPPPSSPFVFLS